MRFRAVVLGVVLAVPDALAVPPELSDRVAAHHPAGCTEHRLLFFPLYRAELWTDAATLPGARFGLSLTYHRGFTREELVSTSISEMVRMSGRAEASFRLVRAELEQTMRSITEGDRYTAWRSGPNRVEFFHNGIATGSLTRDADLFLDIWLGPESRDPKRRLMLLSGHCDD